MIPVVEAGSYSHAVADVHLLSAAAGARRRDPKALLDLEQMRACADADRFGVHRAVDRPSDADLLLFVEVSDAAGAYFERVRSHPAYRAAGDRSYLFSSTDRLVPLLPGVYASIERAWYWTSWARPGHYLGVRESGELHHEPRRETPAYLFSFVGSPQAHAVRARLLRLRHPAALLSGPLPGGAAAYARTIRASEFVLCPRGGGAASFRLFETMMLGRAPVIVSDAWVPPRGPEWPRFSVRVREADVADIPARLTALRPRAQAMGELARAAWLEWFAEDVTFHRVVESCLELAAAAPRRSGLRRYAPYAQLLRPYHAARWASRRLGPDRSRAA